MKTPEFAEAYAWPRPFAGTESANGQRVPFDQRMGDMTLTILELEGPERELTTRIDELNTQLHTEYIHRVTATPVAEELASIDKAQLFSSDLTEEVAIPTTQLYSDLQYEAFAVGWEEMIFGGTYRTEARRDGLRRGQLFLAKQAIELAAVRHPMTLKTTDYPFFSPDMYWARRTMNGIQNEYDTAIALMSLAMLDDELVIVNAPSRFEKAKRGFAVDYLAYHRGSDQIIGVQTKSNYNHAKASDHDDDHVMMVYGTTHMKGTIGTRTKPKSSDVEDVIWPGLLSAEILSSLKLYGPDADIRGDFDLTTALYYKQLAATCQTHPMDRRQKITGSVLGARNAIADELYERLGAERPRRQQPERATNGRVKRKPAKRRR